MNDDKAATCCGGVIALAILWFVLRYLLPYVGMTFIIIVEYIAHSFAWIGIRSPTSAWLALGLLVGGLVGLAVGFKRAGRRADVPKVYGGIGALVVLLLIASHFAGGVQAGSASPLLPAARLLGTWQGTFEDGPGKLYISNASGSEFSGTLSNQTNHGSFEVAFKGRVLGARLDGRYNITFEETKVLSVPPGKIWTLGKNTGVLSSDATRMSGKGSAGPGSGYSWSFSRPEPGGGGSVPGKQPSAGGEFTVSVVRGAFIPEGLAVRVRETSVNYTGNWYTWQAVVGKSYLTDTRGATYQADVSKSVGWQDGPVRPGGSREGRIVFRGVTPNVGELTLNFVYYPPDPAKGTIQVKLRAGAQAAPGSSPTLADLRTAIASGRTFSGEMSEGSKRWPFTLRFISFNPSSGSVTGVLDWPTLDAAHKVEGYLSGQMLAFRETETIRRGNAVAGTVCTLVRAGNRMSGTWELPGSGRKGNAWFDLP